MEEGISTIIDFEMLFNLDYGLIKTIVDKYNNTKFTNDEYLKTITFKNLIDDLINQEINNPLKLAFKEWVDCEELYEQLYETEGEYITKYSSPTKLIGLVIELLRYNSNNTITVICKNKYEEQKVNELYPLLKIVNINYSDINDLEFDCYYCKDINNILKFKDIKHKYIYLASYKYNTNIINNLKDNEEINSKLFSNSLELIDLY